MKVHKLSVSGSGSRWLQGSFSSLSGWQAKERFVPVIFAMLLLISMLLLMPSIGRGQETEVAAGGKPIFDENCMVCHGQGGKGDGVMATFGLLTVPAADLTVLAKKNGGHFPFWRVYGVIDGRDPLKAHGSREMPLWGDEFRLDSGSSAMAQTEVRGKILALVYYLQSIQEK